MTNEMKAEKCSKCPHCERYYKVEGGLLLMCKITGCSITINKCPGGKWI